MFVYPFSEALPADREAFNELLEYHLVAQVYLVIQQNIIYNSNNDNNIIKMIMSNTTTKNTNSKSKEESNHASDR